MSENKILRSSGEGSGRRRARRTPAKTGPAAQPNITASKRTGKIRPKTWIIMATVTLVIGGALILALALRMPGLESRGDGLNSGVTRPLPSRFSEMRGIWIATVANIDYPEKPTTDKRALQNQLDDIIENVISSGANTVLFQVRPSSDALYQSKLFPVSEFLTGEQGGDLPGGFDPYGYLVEEGHRQGLRVYAWINPYRITTGTAESPKTDVNALDKSNPARIHPEWTIAYADGRLYYDPGLPEVRELIVSGVRELVENYETDGVIFDDYFYPYPVKNADFDDDATYIKYGGITRLEDWRRENVNILVRDCYAAIKEINPACEFGIAPFGIWQNDNGSNGGSKTSGFDSYSLIYSDPVAWIKGGYLDFIAPQIYWQFTTSVARFDVLVRWWNAVMSGHESVKLYITHAAYRAPEWDTGEIPQQVEFARSERSYCGSIMYGYGAIKNNDNGVKDKLLSVWNEEIIYDRIGVENGVKLTVTSPYDGSDIGANGSYLIGQCDPVLPLYLNDSPVSLTKSGFFSVFCELKSGANEFLFTHGDESLKYTLYNGKPSKEADVTAPASPQYRTLDSFVITDVSPSSGCIIKSGSTLDISCTAPAGAMVKAELGAKFITLEPLSPLPEDAKAESGFLCQTYKGQFKAPNLSGSGELAELGRLRIIAESGDNFAEADGGRIRLSPKNGFSLAVRVKADDTEIKVAPDSWYYDDYTSSAAGMEDNVIAMKDGWYQLRMKGYVRESDVEEIEGTVPNSVIKEAALYRSGEDVVAAFTIDRNVPFNGYVDDSGRFVMTLYNVSTRDPAGLEIIDNPLFKTVGQEDGARENVYKYYLALKDKDNFYGFTPSYEDGKLLITFRGPRKIDAGSAAPLAGLKIVVDAGHGGSEHGARSPIYGYYEKDMNLEIAKSAARRLEQLGAEVVMTRSDDSLIRLADRCRDLLSIKPDLLISIHQNSMPHSTDITMIRGVVAMYFADAGLPLAKTVSGKLSESLNRLERATRQQRLAIVRNPQFPSALVEVGFITSVEEFDMMMRRGGENIAASGRTIAEGILEYYLNQSRWLVED
ncbi:MAG: family 10 glycosylhydrolase [Eubacteriales bacterium]